MTLFEAGEPPHSCATTKRTRVDSAARTDGATYTPLAAGTRTRCDHCVRYLHTINREGCIQSYKSAPRASASNTDSTTGDSATTTHRRIGSNTRERL